jgi:hypothetical protein
MIDVVGAIVLTVLAITAPWILIAASPVRDGAARRLAIGTGLWLVLVAGLAAAGLFSSASRIGTPAIGVAVLAPIVAIALSTLRRSSLRHLALGVPLAALVGVNAGRLLGVFFVLLLAEGRLPRTFANSAGWGDIVVGALAIPVALAVHRRVTGWRAWTLVWNSVGLLDLIAAVTLGVGSAPASPLRFIYESPESNTMATLPWMVIPGFLVPIYILTHLAIFARLASDDGRAGT